MQNVDKLSWIGLNISSLHREGFLTLVEFIALCNLIINLYKLLREN